MDVRPFRTRVIQSVYLEVLPLDKLMLNLKRYVIPSCCGARRNCVSAAHQKHASPVMTNWRYWGFPIYWWTWQPISIYWRISPWVPITCHIWALFVHLHSPFQKPKVKFPMRSDAIYWRLVSIVVLHQCFGKVAGLVPVLTAVGDYRKYKSVKIFNDGFG